MTPFASAGPVLPLLEGFNPLELDPDFWEIGRASCRERV